MPKIDLKNQIKTVYLSGPMTGHHCKNFEHFFYWSYRLRCSGYDIINPAENECLDLINGSGIQTYDTLLQSCLRVIKECSAQAIFMLPNWEDSVGANKELEAAKEIQMHVFYASDFDI